MVVLIFCGGHDVTGGAVGNGSVVELLGRLVDKDMVLDCVELDVPPVLREMEAPEVDERGGSGRVCTT